MTSAEITVVDLRDCSSQAEMADAVLAATRGQFAIAGQSMGGWVAQAVAARAPARVTKLALLNSWARPDPAFNRVQRRTIADIQSGGFEKALDEHLPRVLHEAHLRDAALVAELRAMQRRAGPDVFVRHIQAMIDAYDSTRWLAAIRCPTLVVAARQDAIFPLAEQRFIADTVASAHLAVIEDCGHGSPIEQPEAVTALMRYWLTYF